MDAIFLLSAIVGTIAPMLVRKHIPKIMQSISAWLWDISTPGRLQRMSRFGKLFSFKEGIPFWINFFQSLFTRQDAEKTTKMLSATTVVHPLPMHRGLLVPPRKVVCAPMNATWDIESHVALNVPNLDELNALLTSMRDFSPSEVIFAISKFSTTIQVG